MNLVTPKVGAKHELLLYKLTSDLRPKATLLRKGSCLARALGVTKFIGMRDVILVTLYCATQV
jgi:hypothetical protein